MSRTLFRSDNQVAYDKVPVQFKVLPGVREKLKAVPNWQERLRDFVDQLILEESCQNDKQ
ncbi:hypothetical protein SAMD00079811_48980 [Scytonema sp. HK-05]|uniref:hypothetical protein n=1 Tax=Scytonema sp. HK-05 TaxID=1137095 RepID=UPI00093652E2|nr:hypothetical protein [Scytonema sp. HK-05]OKH57332.1 hypothetical protein NIES2130_20370 [Scytonema sp. HK-05]BAY47281.1 hypothetical protein SAMD00079811_48980 [Scytonema sp. HK-05]